MGHISALPTELLVSIFLILRDEAPSTWLRVLPVCRRWYKVASSAPVLWTQLTFRPWCDRDLLEKFLHRSSNLALDLTLDIHAVECSPILDIVRRYSVQLRTLSVIFSPPQSGELQTRLGDRRFSGSILTLNLHCVTSEGAELLLDASALTALRELRAVQVLPHARFRPFRGVTLLQLTQIWHVIRPEEHPTRYDLLLTIDSFPDLELLSLSDALPPCIHFGNTTFDQVTLPSLHMLEMNETMEDIKFFLHHLALPVSARFTIVARVAEAMWEPDIGGVFLAILPDNRDVTLPMVPQSCALRLFAGHTERGALTLTGAHDPEALTEYPAWSTVLPDCKEVLVESVRVALQELPAIVAPSALVHLELHIAPHVLVFDVDWPMILYPLDRLKSLVVGSRWASEGVVTTLYRHKDVLPGLQQLELCINELQAASDRPVPPPSANTGPRRLEKVIITQSAGVPEPYLQGTTIGSMLHASRYEFQHSACSACHVTDRVLASGQNTPGDIESSG
ncbi:hypothetical protein BD414DRAFT_470438 [Trametes punicea]|nr:hypothetical protein BD414DRAFT_470438 [Trametes punicea]